MYTLKVRSHFDAAHCLANYVGKCAAIHGHRWEYEIAVEGFSLDRAGMLIDFGKVKEMLRDGIEELLDHSLLVWEKHPEFDSFVSLDGFRPLQFNPTAENLAEFIYRVLRRMLACGVSLKSVTVWESPDCAVTYESL